MIGRTLSHYEILEKLGEGGMGVVYKARDPRLGRLVAIKVLPPNKVADAERKSRFIQEAKAASALNHPNIVTIYDIGSEHGADFIVMEYIDGKQLSEIIPHQGMRLNDALNCAIPVADALARAHASGIVHRDLKPANVMVASDGAVKLLDFGLAKLVENAPVGPQTATATMGQPHTEEGSILGTVAYMSPEQAEAKPIDARSDIFSFGAVLYEMVTGQKAFQGDSRMSTLAAILREEPRPPGTLVSNLPREIERLITRCLRKDPNKRWQSIADVRTSLEEFKQDSDSGISRTNVAVPVKKNRKGVYAVIATAVLVAAAGAVWFIRGASEASTKDESLQAVPLTTYPGTESFPSFSPDGSQVVFSWDGESQDNSDIYVKRVGPGPPLRLTRDPAVESSPAWSPDGSTIAFARATSRERCAIVLVPPLGGPERILTDSFFGNSVNRIVEWTPNSKGLVVSEGPGEMGGLWLVSVETGERRRLTRSDRLWDTNPSFAPDGQSLAFSRTVPNSNHYQERILPLDQNYTPTGEPKVLPKTAASGAVWTADSRGLVLAFGAPGNTRLWRVATDGTMLKQLAEGVITTGLASSARASRLIYAKDTREMDLYRVELSADGVHASNPIPLIASSKFERYPSYPPDGRKIAFTSLRSGRWQVWVSDSDGKNPIELTSVEPIEIQGPTWSSDGNQIGFIVDYGAAFEAYVVPAAGGKPKKLDLPQKNVRLIQWSRDGHWLVYSNPEGIWKMPGGGGTPVRLTSAGAWPIESADGTSLYYQRPGEIWSVPIAGGEGRKLFDISGTVSAFMAATKLGIYLEVNSSAARPGQMMFYKLPNGPLTKVEGVDAPGQYGHTVSPDGKYLLYNKMTATGSDLMLIENFR